jgi:hypothetical protein
MQKVPSCSFEVEYVRDSSVGFASHPAGGVKLTISNFSGRCAFAADTINKIAGISALKDLFIIDVLSRGDSRSLREYINLSKNARAFRKMRTGRSPARYQLGFI